MSAGECIAVCPCCLARVIVPMAAGSPPVLNHGKDRLSGEDCPRIGWPVVDATMWNYSTPEQQQATINDFPEVFA